jgi:hypothetical protein
MVCCEWLVSFAQQGKQVFCTQNAEPFLAVTLVRYNGHFRRSCVTLGLLHPEVWIASFYALYFPVDAGQRLADYVRAVGTAAELLSSSCVKACVAQLVAPFSFSPCAFCSGIDRHDLKISS